MLDLRRLRLLKEFAGRGTIAATAAALGYTPSAVSQQLAALEREAQLRVAELRQKSVLHVDLRLLQLLRVEQPKLLVRCVLTAEDHVPGKLEVVWDPLLEAVEAVPCQLCGKPSYDFTLSRYGQVGCAACKPSFTSRKPPSRG